MAPIDVDKELGLVMSDLAVLAKDMTSDADIQHMLENLDSFNADELAEIDKIVDELSVRNKNKAAYDELMSSVRGCSPTTKLVGITGYWQISSWHWRMGARTGSVANIPPRHGKSQLVSIFYPAWFLGRNPGKKVMMVSHTTDLAVDFGRKVRNPDRYRAHVEIFPELPLRWTASRQVDGTQTLEVSILRVVLVLLLLVGVLTSCSSTIPILGKDVINGNFSVFEKAYEWFTFGALTPVLCQVVE